MGDDPVRKQIIRRVAAGTCSVCMAYALMTQSLDALSEKNSEPAPSWTNTLLAVAEEQAPLPAATEVSSYYSDRSFSDSGRHGKRGHGARYGSFENNGSRDGQSSASGNSSKEDPAYGASNEDTGASVTVQDTTVGGEPPTLAQFLSLIRCGGCRHGCLLVSPRCMKGRSKAATATTRYYAQYGG